MGWRETLGFTEEEEEEQVEAPATGWRAALGFSDAGAVPTDTEYWTNMFRMMQMSNVIGRPEFAQRVMPQLDVPGIMQQAYPAAPAGYEDFYQTIADLGLGAGTQPRETQPTGAIPQIVTPTGRPYDVQGTIPREIAPQMIEDQMAVTRGELSLAEFQQKYDPLPGIARYTDMVTWPVQGAAMTVNSYWNFLFPHRARGGAARGPAPPTGWAPGDVLERAKWAIAGPEGDLATRLESAFAGEEWEMIHPDITSVLWEPVHEAAVAVTGTLAGGSPFIPGSLDLASAMMFSGEPDALLHVQANRQQAASAFRGVFEGEEYDPFWEEQIPPLEAGVREFAALTVIDPLMWIPGAGGFIGAGTSAGTRVTAVDDMVNLLEGMHVNPTSGNLLPSWEATTLATGMRPPTMGEWLGWGTNRVNNYVNRLLDPYRGFRQSALKHSRWYGAEALRDLEQTAVWEQQIALVAERLGRPVEEVSANATRIIEEVFAADHFSLRNRTSLQPPRRVTTMGATERGTLEAQRAIEAGADIPRPVATGEIPAPTIQERLFGEAPEAVSPIPAESRIVGMTEEGLYYPGYRRPVGAGRDYVPGVSEIPVEAGVRYQDIRRPITAAGMEPVVRTTSPFTGMRSEVPTQWGTQRFLFDPESPRFAPDWQAFIDDLTMTGEESAARASTMIQQGVASNYRRNIVDNIINVQSERFRLGRLGTEPNRALYEAMPMPELEVALEGINNKFITEQVDRLAGIRAFERSVMTQQGLRPAVMTQVSDVIRESLPAFRGASNEVVRDFANVLYEGVWDSMNVGPRAPMMRERLAGIMTESLDSNLGYLRHIPDENLIQTFEEAARAAGWTITDSPLPFMRGPNNITRQQLIDELGNAIGHGSLKQRMIPYSISGGNEMSAAGRVGWEVPTVPGQLPKLRFLAEGAPTPANWVPVEKLFIDDLPTIVGTRRLAATGAVAGVNYLDDVTTRFGTYSPSRRVPGATSIYDLQGMSQAGTPTQRWANTFGNLTDDMQNRLQHTYFPDLWSPGDTARAVLNWEQLGKGNRFMHEMIPLERMLWSHTRPLSTYWKAKTLYPFVSYHLRNHYDDCVRLSTWFDRWSPTDVEAARATLYNGRVPPHVQEYLSRIVGKPAAEITLEETLYQARAGGIIESGMYWDEVNNALARNLGRPDRWRGTNAVERLRNHGLTGTGEHWAHSPANPFSTNAIADQMGREFGRDWENIRRLSGWYAGMREPGLPLEALNSKVLNVMIDYLDLDPITRMAREVIPFLTFQRHAIPLNVRSLFERGGRVSMRLRAYDTIDQMYTQMNERDDPPPAWNEGRAYRVGDHYWFTPYNFDSVFDFEEIMGTFQRFTSGDRTAGGQLVGEYLGPWITEIPEQLFNWDSWRGQPIYDRWEGDKVPQFLLDLGLDEEAGARLWHGMTSTWRAARDLEGVWAIASGAREMDPAWVMRRTGGIPIHGAEPEQTAHFLLRNNQDQLEHLGLGFQYGNWSTYGIIPERYDDAAQLFGERLMTHMLVDEYLMIDPWTGEPRPLEEDVREYSGEVHYSQETMLNRMSRDIAGCFSLMDQWHQDVVDGRITGGDADRAPFTDRELDFMDRLNQSIMLTRIALSLMAAQEGELDPATALNRARSRMEQLEPIIP